MNHRKMIPVSSVLRAVFAMAALVFSATVFAADPKIDLYVTEVDGQPKLRFSNSECSTGVPGEVCVGKGSKVWIMWELDNDSHGAGWDLSGLTLSWDSTAPVNCIVGDFIVDDRTGEALDFRVQANGKQAMNRDRNDCATPYEVNYTIRATHRTMDITIDSDPIIRNGGRN